MAPLVRTGGSRHTGLAAPPHRNIQQCEEINEKYIELVVKRKHETTFIKCVNSCVVQPKIIGGKFISIKKDTDRKHGYGMKSIDKIVNKYHGSHIEQFDENEFTISIILMI